MRDLLISPGSLLLADKVLGIDVQLLIYLVLIIASVIGGIIQKTRSQKGQTPEQDEEEEEELEDRLPEPLRRRPTTTPDSGPGPLADRSPGDVPSIPWPTSPPPTAPPPLPRPQPQVLRPAPRPAPERLRPRPVPAPYAPAPVARRPQVEPPTPRPQHIEARPAPEERLRRAGEPMPRREVGTLRGQPSGERTLGRLGAGSAPPSKPPPKSAVAEQLERMLRNRSQLQAAFVLREVLGPPLALRDSEPSSPP